MRARRTLIFAIAALVLLVLLAGLGLWLSTTSFYTWAMRKNVEGEVVSIANMTPQAVIGARPGVAAGDIIYSFAIAIKTPDGTIYPTSSEDRQWAIVKEGYRVRATLFPYSPLEWRKQGTYHGARLAKILSATPATDTERTPAAAPNAP
jgi:hypothetical protein